MNEVVEELRLVQGPLAAFVLSALIGWEREWRGRGAGLRTHILVGMGSALFVVLADTIIVRFAGDAAQVRFDLIGLLGAVVSGVSFLGAGIIFSDRGRPRGVTTAAGLLVTAGVGVACGLHLYVFALAMTLLLLVTLNLLGRLSRQLSAEHDDSVG